MYAPDQYALEAMSSHVFLKTYHTLAIHCDGEGDIPVSGHIPDLLDPFVAPIFPLLNGLPLHCLRITSASDEYAL